MPFDLDPIAAGAEVRYATEAAWRLFLGTINATSLIDGDGDELSDPGAAAQVLEQGANTIDLHAAGGPGLIPLTFADTPAGAIGAAIVERWNVGLASYYAAQKRGLSGVEAGNRYKELRDEILAEIKAYREGTLALPGVVEDPNDVADQAGGFRSRRLIRSDMVCTAGDEFSSN